MNRVFQVVAIDDNPDTLEPVLKTVQAFLECNQLKIEYKILSKQSELEQLQDNPFDIVMFDCSLSGGNFDFENNPEAQFGWTLLKRYREKNKRTKIIYYSGSFSFTGDCDFGLTSLEFVQIINELKIFAITNREYHHMANAIKSAIDELDTVLISMEDLICNYGENGIFVIDGQKVTARQLLTELRMGTSIGEKFREEIYQTIISYFMKFGGK